MQDNPFATGLPLSIGHGGPGQPALAALVSAEEAERKRLAGYLHDTVLQDLGLCYLKVELCERLGAAGQAERAQKEAAGLHEILDRVVDEVRGVMGELLPVKAAGEDDNLLATYCLNLAARGQPPVRVETPVPALADRWLQIFLVRVIESAVRASAGASGLAGLTVAFRDAHPMVMTTVELRCWRGEAPASFSSRVDLSCLHAVRVKAEIGGGWSRIDETPQGLRLLFVLPVGGRSEQSSLPRLGATAT